MADADVEKSEWMRAKEVCAMKGWSMSNLDKKVAAGLVVRYRIKGMRPMYKRSELTEDAIFARGLSMGLATSGARRG